MAVVWAGSEPFCEVGIGCDEFRRKLRIGCQVTPHASYMVFNVVELFFNAVELFFNVVALFFNVVELFGTRLHQRFRVSKVECVRHTPPGSAALNLALLICVVKYRPRPANPHQSAGQ